MCVCVCMLLDGSQLGFLPVSRSCLAHSGLSWDTRREGTHREDDGVTITSVLEGSYSRNVEDHF